MESKSSDVNISPRTFLEYQSIDEIKSTVPLKPIDSDRVRLTEGPALVSAVHQLTTESGFKPYENAEVGLVRVNNTDIDKIKLTQTYALESRLNNLSYLALLSREFGVDIFNLNGIVTITSENGEQIAKVSPPVAEVTTNPETGEKEFKLVSGHQRLILAHLLGSDINIITVENFDKNHSRPYLPVDFHDVKIVKSPPPDHLKRTLIPGRSNKDICLFNSFGEDGTRRSVLDSQKEFFPDDPTKGSRNLSRQINQVFRGLNASGLFPSAINAEASPDRESRVVKVNGATPLDGKHFLADFNIDWQGDQVPPSHYIVVTETRQESKTPAELVVVTSEQHETNIPPANEISISPEIRQQINEQLVANGFSPIASEDNPDISSNSPAVSGFELVDSNPNFFSTLTITTGDQKFSYIINHPREYNGQVQDGTAILLRTEEGIFLKKRYRELFGMTFTELPRMFGFDPTRFYRETGVKLDDQVNFDHNRLVVEARQFSINNLALLSGNLPEGVVPQNPYQEHDGVSKEISKLVLFTDAEIHEVISQGNLNCDITNASLTIDQLARGILVANPIKNPDNTFVVLEKYLSPLESKYYYQPPKSKTGTGNRVGQNNFPNTGVALIFQHTEIGDVDSLPPGKCYQSFSINEIVEMITSEQLDSTAVANLSTALRNQGYLVLAN